MFELLITRPLGFIIKLIYDLVQNYGFTIIIFTVLIKLILMPLAVKSQKAMRKQQKIQPYLQELQQKYANDKERLQMETMKLYKDNNISMTGGCLPMLIQFPILIGLYRVIQRPLTYLANVDFSLQENMTKIADLVTRMTAEFPEKIGKLASVSAEQLSKGNQIDLSTWSETLNGALDPWVINFSFLGLDLSNAPSKALSMTEFGYVLLGEFSHLSSFLILLIPVVAVFTTWLSMRQSQKMTQGTNASQGENPAQSMTKSMNIMMPVMTGIFTFTLPSGLGLYWIASNLMQMLQQVLIDLYFKKKGDDFDVKIPERNRKNSKKHR